MEGSIILRNQAMGRDRAIVTQIDKFRAGEIAADRISGADNYVSGYDFLAVITSNIGRIRPLNISMQNAESAAMTVLFRDGGITGTIVCGPYVLNPTQDRTIPESELGGRAFLSSMYAVVISGTFASGIETQVGYVIDPDDYFE